MIKKDVRSLSLEDLRAFFADKGFQAFRGNQVYEWLWKKSITDIDQMTNISKDCLLYTSPSPRDSDSSRMPSSA